MRHPRLKHHKKKFQKKDTCQISLSISVGACGSLSLLASAKNVNVTPVQQKRKRNDLELLVSGGFSAIPRRITRREKTSFCYLNELLIESVIPR